MAYIAAGQWWRLVTALFVQYDAVRQIVVVLACIAAVGVPAGPRQLSSSSTVVAAGSR